MNILGFKVYRFVVSTSFFHEYVGVKHSYYNVCLLIAIDERCMLVNLAHIQNQGMSGVSCTLW